MRFRFVGYLIFSMILLFSLDRFIYRFLIYQPENHSGWDSYRWYNFEHNNRQLITWRESNPDKKLVLVVGSSIAKYSVLTRMVQDILHLRGLKKVEVRNFMHAAMTPADLYFYRKRILDLNPQVIVYPINPADLDLERYSEPWQSAKNYEDDFAFKFMSFRHPGKLLHPGVFAEEFGFKKWGR